MLIYKSARGLLIVLMLVAVSMATGVSAAATDTGQASADSAKLLAERAKQYWDYKVAGAMDKAYELEDPRAREKLSLKTYLTEFGTGVKWLSAEIGPVNLDATPALVTVTINYVTLLSNAPPIKGRTRTIQDKWVLINNQWYHHLAPAAAPPKDRPPAGKGA